MRCLWRLLVRSANQLPWAFWWVVFATLILPEVSHAEYPRFHHLREADQDSKASWLGLRLALAPFLGTKNGELVFLSIYSSL